MVWLLVVWLGSVYTTRASGVAAGPLDGVRPISSPRPAGTTMTASRSPARILVRLSSCGPSVSLSSPVAATPDRNPADAVEPSRSTQPTLKVLELPPEKMDPNRTTNMTGKAMVQNTAVRSRRKLRMLARVRASSARMVG